MTNISIHCTVQRGLCDCWKQPEQTYKHVELVILSCKVAEIQLSTGCSTEVHNLNENMLYFYNHQGRINTKLGLMLLPRKGPIFFSALKTAPLRRKTSYSSMVQFEINIKISTINGEGLNRLIARKETRIQTQLSQRDRAAGWELRRNVCCSSQVH